MINRIMTKIVEVTMAGRVKEIEEIDGKYRITILYSTREFYLEKNRIELLPILKKSKSEETPITIVFDGKTGVIIKAARQSPVSP